MFCEKRIENLEFVQGDNIDSLKQRCKVLVFFDDSSEKICNSKTFVDFATGGRRHGLSTVYIKHNLFRESKFMRKVEL